MTSETGVLRRIVWRDIFPGLILFRCFRLSISLPILFLATLGTLLMPIGPWGLGKAFPIRDPSASLFEPQIQIPEGAPTSPPPIVAPVPSTSPFGWLPKGLVKTYQSLIQPFVQLFDPRASFGAMVGNLFIGLWYLLIWSFFGGAITRIAVVQLGRGESVSLRESFRHVVPKYGWYVAAPLFPLLGVALTVIPLLVLGLVMRLSLGVFLAGILWPLVLIAGFVMAVLLTELVFGWPLMWPTISTEEASDSFQAFSNSFSFTFQRPLQYLAYAVIAVLLAGLGGWFVEAFAEALVVLNHWAISLGLGSERLQQILSGELDESRLIWFGSNLIQIGDGLVLMVARAFYFSFLFCAASAIYLLLRREVDQTDFDEVYMPEDTGRYSLPPLRPGAHGVPEIDEPPPTTTEATSE